MECMRILTPPYSVHAAVLCRTRRIRVPLYNSQESILHAFKLRSISVYFPMQRYELSESLQGAIQDFAMRLSKMREMLENIANKKYHSLFPILGHGRESFLRAP
jgi:hypothetical protein